MNALQRSWSRLWKGLGASGDGNLLMTRLIAAYEEPQRKYHTLRHLSECLAVLEPNLGLAERPEEVEAALWFHDVVYDVRGEDNESKSASLAETELAAAGVGRERRERIRNLILATRHSAPPEELDEKLLVDVDLAILGAPRPRFVEYEAQVWEEYNWVPAPSFREKRREALQRFVNREFIYSTEAFRESLERQAQDNLAESIRSLRDAGSRDAGSGLIIHH